jgi:hypothetical protein
MAFECKKLSFLFIVIPFTNYACITFLVLFLRQDLTVQPGWPWPLDPPASAFPVLGSQATTLGLVTAYSVFGVPTASAC